MQNTTTKTTKERGSYIMQSAAAMGKAARKNPIKSALIERLTDRGQLCG